MKNNLELCEYVKSKLGTNYVYGMKMQVMTKSKYDSLVKRFGKELVWPSDANKIGTVCTDCSGLPSSFTGVEKSSQMYYNEAKERHPLSDIEDAPVGVLLWMQGHVGVYIGNNKCIEARGSAYGVVCTTVSSRPWQHWFSCNDIEYIPVEKPSYYITGGPYLRAEAERLRSALPGSFLYKKEG